MKVLHLNAGNETGGGMVHILSLLKELTKETDQFILGLFEKGLFYEKAVNLGIQTITFEQSSRYDFSILIRLIKFIKKEKIDIIHTHGARANLYGYFILKFTRVTWMTTVHSDPRNDFLGRGLGGKIFTKLNLMVLKKPDHYFAISKRFAEMLAGFGVAFENITTILNGIDFNHQSKKKHNSRAEMKLSPEDFVILMVARFDPVKRHDLAIKALEKIVDRNQAIKLLLVGDGPNKKAIEKLVHQKRLEKSVQFFGFREDVNDFYSLADVTLLTSATESFPLVLLESSREKTPVITTDVGGVRDMIPNASFSLVLDNSNVNEISDALEQYMKLKEEQKLEEIGERFYQFTSQRFSVQFFAKSVYDVYKMWK